MAKKHTKKTNSNFGKGKGIFNWGLPAAKMLKNPSKDMKLKK